MKLKKSWNFGIHQIPNSNSCQANQSLKISCAIDSSRRNQEIGAAKTWKRGCSQKKKPAMS